MSDKEARTLKWPGWAKITIGSAIALVSGAVSYYLLNTQPQFNGTNAVALFTIGMASGLMVAMSDFIQIIEWGSLKIQTNEYNKKARETLASLRSAQATTYRTLIRLSLRPITPMRDRFSEDHRVYELRSIARDIEESNLKGELKQDMLSASKGLGTEVVQRLQSQMIAPDTNPYEYTEIIRKGREWLEKSTNEGMQQNDHARYRKVENDIMALSILNSINKNFIDSESPSA